MIWEVGRTQRVKHSQHVEVFVLTVSFGLGTICRNEGVLTLSRPRPRSSKGTQSHIQATKSCTVQVQVNVEDPSIASRTLFPDQEEVWNRSVPVPMMTELGTGLPLLPHFRLRTTLSAISTTSGISVAT